MRSCGPLRWRVLREKDLDRLTTQAAKAVAKELSKGKMEACVVQVLVQEIDPVTRQLEQAHRMELSYLPPKAEMH